MKSRFRLSYVCNLVLPFRIEIVSAILLSTHFPTVAAMCLTTAHNLGDYTALIIRIV